MGTVPVNTFAAAIQTIDLDPADVEIFPAISYKNRNKLLKDELGFTDNEIGIIVKRAAKEKYKDKRIRIPDKINGKTVVALGHPEGITEVTQGGMEKMTIKGFFNDFTGEDNRFYAQGQTRYIIYPDLSNATHIKYIADGAFFKTFKRNSLEIKNVPNLALIGYKAFSGDPSEIILENLPKLARIDNKAFDSAGNWRNKVKLSNLPSLKSIGEKSFSYRVKLVEINDIPNLETLGRYAFYNVESLAKDVDLSSAKNLKKISNSAFFGKHQAIKISKPGSNFTGDYYMYTGFGNGVRDNYAGLHRLTFEFTATNGKTMPNSLKAKQPEPWYVYPGFDRNGIANPIEKLNFTIFTDPATDNDWEFKGWKTNDNYHIINNKNEAKTWNNSKKIFDVKYTGTWELLVNKKNLAKKVTEAETLLRADSTTDPAKALQVKVNEAKTLIQAVDARTEKSQEKVDAKATELGNAIQALKDLNTKK